MNMLYLFNVLFTLLFIVQLGNSQSFCPLSPEPIPVAVASPGPQGNMDRAIDGDNSTFWSANHFNGNPKWKMILQEEYINVVHVQVIIQANTPPNGSVYNGYVRGYVHVETNPVAEYPPGGGWLELPFAAGYCNAEDFEVIGYNLTGNRRNVGSLCLAYQSNGCSPASLVWWMALREVNLFHDCNPPTATASRTPSRSPTSSKSRSGSQTPSQSHTRTPSGTQTNSDTPTRTQTATNSITSTNSATITPSNTPSTTISSSPTPSNTPSASSTASAPETPSETTSSTVSPTTSISQSCTGTPTSTPSRTAPRTISATRTSTKTSTPSTSNTHSSTSTETLSKTITASRTSSATMTESETKSITQTPTSTPTGTPSPTGTPTTTTSASVTISSTASTTETPTMSPSTTKTNSRTQSSFPTLSNSRSPSKSHTSSNSFSKTPSGSRTSSKSNTITPSTTSSTTESKTPSKSPSSTKTPTSDKTPTKSISSTVTSSSTHSESITSSSTSSPTKTKTSTSSPSPTNTASTSGTMTPTSTGTSTISLTPTNTAIETLTETGAATQSARASDSFSVSLSISNSKKITTFSSISIYRSSSSSPSTEVIQREIIGPDLGDSDSSVLGYAFSPSPDPNPPVILPVSVSCTRDCYQQTITSNQIQVLIVDGGNIIGLITADNASIGEGNSLQVNLEEFPSAETNSHVVDISLQSFDGHLLQPQGNVEICLSVNKTINGQCLAVFDELKNIWQCEDSCLTISDGLLCGETSHFSRFTILLDPTGKRSKDCSSDSWVGITGAQWSDYLVIISVIGFVCCVAWTFAIVVTMFFPSVHGKEHKRLVLLRSKQMTSVLVQ